MVYIQINIWTKIIANCTLMGIHGYLMDWSIADGRWILKTKGLCYKFEQVLVLKLCIMKLF
jgi:hypothetical protein